MNDQPESDVWYVDEETFTAVLAHERARWRDLLDLLADS